MVGENQLILDRSALSQALLDYFDSIDEAARMALNSRIPNSTPLHATYLIDKLVSLASESIDLFSGELAAEVDGQEIYAHPQLLDAATQAAKRGVRFRVLTETNIDFEEHDFIRAVRKGSGSEKSSVQYSAIPPDVLSEMKRVGADQHFLVSDRRAYRLENSDAKHRSVSAIANFGDKETAKKLARRFGAIIERVDLHSCPAPDRD